MYLCLVLLEMVFRATFGPSGLRTGASAPVVVLPRVAVVSAPARGDLSVNSVKSIGTTCVWLCYHRFLPKHQGHIV